MNKCNFDFDLNLANIENIKFNETYNSLLPEITNIKESLKLKYETNYASLNVLNDLENLKSVNSLIKLKKKLNINSIVVIGIGGSNLGTMAIHESLFGSFNNEKNSDPNIYFPDTVDSDYLFEIIEIIETQLKNNKNVLVNVVTKSGTTIETISIFEIFLELLKKYKPQNYKDYIVVTTDKNSRLWEYANSNKIDLLEIPKKVGGRYSVFSPVGLFPLAFCGVDINKLLAGAKDMISNCLDQNIVNNPAATSANIIYNNYVNGCNIHDTFIFCKKMSFLGAWYRQLVGESLGKKVDKHANIIETGITPTTSIGTTDLHSVAQLYLGGPRDKFTTFVSVKPKASFTISNLNEINAFGDNMHGKELSFIMDSVVGGVKAAYKNSKRPYVSVDFSEISEYSIGQFMQWKMLETIYLGYLLNVNPFDQPEVELYKNETKRILNQ